MTEPRTAPFSATPRAYEALAELSNRVWPEQPCSVEWLVRRDAQSGSSAPVHRVVVQRDDDPARFAGMAEWSRDRFSCDDGRFVASIAVDPAWQRRGIGAMLFGSVMDQLPAAPRRVLECEATEDRPEAVAFLLRRGFRRVRRIAVSELDLAQFEPSHFEADVRWAEASGILLRSIAVTGTDDATLRAVHALHMDAVLDAPGARSGAHEPFESWRRAFVNNPDLLTDAHVLAYDGDMVVGTTQLWASQATDAILYTGFTGVARGHRRRGIATALKVRSLRAARLLRALDGRHPVVRTANAETNPMLAINVRLGFVERPARLQFELAG